MGRAPRIDCALVVGGRYHDFDFVRLQLLCLLAEHERVRVAVHSDWRDAERLCNADFLVSYTCDCIPDETGTVALERFLEAGGRWFALHGTNSLLDLADDRRVRCPPLPTRLRLLLGSQFQAHPPFGRFKVEPACDHPLITGIDAFYADDELYLQVHEPGNIPLLVTHFAGETPQFERSPWQAGPHQVMYLRPRGHGGVLYLTLGHARGRYDMRPLAESYPFVERGAWVLPVFVDLLRRGLLWAMGRVGRPPPP